MQPAKGPDSAGAAVVGVGIDGGRPSSSGEGDSMAGTLHCRGFAAAAAASRAPDGALRDGG